MAISVPKPPCMVEGCDRNSHCRGWCKLHYERWRRLGSPTAPGTRNFNHSAFCSVGECSEPYHARGYCKYHYERWQKRGDAEAPFLQKKGKHRYDLHGNRWCSRCRTYLSMSQFTADKTWCRSCRRLSRYRMDRIEYLALLESQNNQCLICQGSDPDAIDHDQKCCSGRQTCGKCVRGILCRTCNAAMGRLEKHLDRLNSYLGKA